MLNIPGAQRLKKDKRIRPSILKPAPPFWIIDKRHLFPPSSDTDILGTEHPGI